MNKVVCDGCGTEYEHASRLGYRLDYKGSMSGDVWDFCSDTCVLDWALASLRQHRDRLAEQAIEQAKGKR